MTKIPLLGDLPVIGNLFKNTATLTDRTEDDHLHHTARLVGACERGDALIPGLRKRAAYAALFFRNAEVDLAYANRSALRVSDWHDGRRQVDCRQAAGAAVELSVVDADRELEARSGVPIPTIFEIEGRRLRRREIVFWAN